MTEPGCGFAAALAWAMKSGPDRKQFSSTVSCYFYPSQLSNLRDIWGQWTVLLPIMTAPMSGVGLGNEHCWPPSLSVSLCYLNTPQSSQHPPDHLNSPLVISVAFTGQMTQA